MISMKMSATQWLASACRNSVRLVDGPARLRQEKSARSQASAYFRAHAGTGVFSEGAPAYHARIALPAQQLTNGGVRGPQPWRDAPVIT
ncbi:hypothetical protein HII36_35865 [Nonomuraea sp. NN258]|uniref:hypothetical protein n=1 Tax=Nonomuraea antri TaxID=2730852 RepID=UPI0015689072|nr:hypothetical protein [Nonomuraea antri]NRQ37175.1 hypothetical protein [Nonomuraea antri]